DITPALEEVVNKALAYEVDKRFANANELSIALARSLGSSRTLDTSRIGESAPLATAPVSGTGTVSGQVTADPQRTTGAAPQPPVPEVKPLWRFQCEDELRSSPRILASLMYIGCYDHN